MKSNRFSKKDISGNSIRMLMVITSLSIILWATGCGILPHSNSKNVSDTAISKSVVNTDKAMSDTAATSAEAPRADAAKSAPAIKAVDQALQIDSAAAMNTDVQSSAVSVGYSVSDNMDAYNRKLVYKADLSMEVKDYGKVQSDIRTLIQQSGGYILQFSDSNSTQEKGGSFVVKVPSNGFMPFINSLEQMKPVSLSKNLQGQDVTEEYVDLTSRLTAKKVVETRLLAFMEKAAKADDLVSFSNELAKVQEEIEQIKGRMRYLDQNVAYSTINIRLFERIKSSEALAATNHPFSDRMVNTMKASINVLGIFFQSVLLIIIAVLPVAVVIVLIALPSIYIYRRLKRISRQ